MADRGRHFAAPGRTHRSWPQRGVITLSALLTTAMVGAAGFVVWVYETVGELPRISRDVLDLEAAPPGEPENFLIIGSDSRGNIDPDDPAFDDVLPGVVSGARTDTIILARVDPEDAHVEIVSFPRDLWIPIVDEDTGELGGPQRINTAFGDVEDGGGPQRVADTIELNFGITVNHYIEVDFIGFQGMINGLGGVPVYLDGEYRDPNSGLEVIGPGCVTLSGDTALAFARSRHMERRLPDERNFREDPSSDLGRIARQQFLIRKAMEQALSLNPFTNALTFTNLLQVAVDSITVDAGMSNDALRDLASRFQGFDPESIVNHALPVSGFTTNGGAAVLDLDDEAAQPIFDVFRGIEPGEVVPERVDVRVQNGTGTDRQAGDTAEALAAVGFDVAADGDAEPTATTTIRFAPGSENAAHLLARHLTSRATFLEDANLVLNELVLVTGADFTTVVRQPWSPEAVPVPTTATTTVPATTAPDPGVTTTTTPPPTTTSTTTIGFLPEAPDGVEC